LDSIVDRVATATAAQHRPEWLRRIAMKKDTKQGKKPFFARLLETQELEHVVGGRPMSADATNKYPSDSDEVAMPVVGPNGADTTHKFPSDSDEAL
jgi:serine endopeptidase inhibitor I10-like protein